MEIPGDVYKILCLRGLKWVINNNNNKYFLDTDGPIYKTVVFLHAIILYFPIYNIQYNTMP